MKKMATCLGLTLITSASIALGGWDRRAPLATAQATFKAVDADGGPVTNALVSVGFFHRDPEQSRRYEAFTGTNGCATLEGQSTGQLAYWISKDGYYESNGGYKGWMEKWTPPNSPNIQNGRWQPWSPIFDVVLKKIKNPVPMYVKSIRTDIPVTDKTIGFDLEKADWVVPHGVGIHGDILFKLYRDIKSWQDYRSSLTISFMNEGDGIQNIYATHKEGSKLTLPYSAPQEGYATNLFFEESNDKYQEEREDQNYIFRVRTILDRNGKIVSALYGKIHGNILFDVRSSGTSCLLFTYYLNPTPNDRNIEFDPEKNLFGGRDRFAP
jgi:hypothetical protein